MAHHAVPGADRSIATAVQRGRCASKHVASSRVDENVQLTDARIHGPFARPA